VALLGLATATAFVACAHPQPSLALFLDIAAFLGDGHITRCWAHTRSEEAIVEKEVVYVNRIDSHQPVGPPEVPRTTKLIRINWQRRSARRSFCGCRTIVITKERIDIERGDDVGETRPPLCLEGLALPLGTLRIARGASKPFPSLTYGTFSSYEFVTCRPS
jgi:hypothetical protein